MPDDHEFITVEKEKIVRCAWCGTAVSEDNWIHFKMKHYCSKDCLIIEHRWPLNNPNIWIRTTVSSCLVGCIFGPLLAVLYGIVLGSGPLVLLGVIIQCILFLLAFDWQNENEKKRVHLRETRPKGSRRVLREPMRKMILKDSRRVGVSTTFTCPNCLAPLKISDAIIGKNYECENCGLELTISTPPEIPLPQESSSQSERPVKMMCPHCAATYSYGPEKIDSDGTVSCQNCGSSIQIS
ncbi:MAG: hypothetical protein ACFFER_14925 [Candidatus Thorarchaeota archaeon]